MALQVINVGAAPNDGTGDPIRTAYIKCNDNFAVIYSRAQTTPPASLIGSPGDQAGMYAYDSSFWYYCFANYNGVSTIWAQVSQLGNVSVSQIVNGTSSIKITNSAGNANISIGGTSNVAVFSTTGQYVNGEISATGNVAGNYILGDGSLLTGIPASYSDSNVVSLLAAFGSNIVSTTGAITSGSVSATGNITGGNIRTAGLVTATGNVTGGNIRTAGVVSATGNISGNYFIGNGSLLTGIAAGSTYSDSNVVSLLSAFGSNTVSTTGAITGGNITGGNLLTTGLVSATGTITGADITGANITGGNLLTGGLVSAASHIGSVVSVSANVTGGNILTGGGISATGNITAAGNVSGTYFIGDGSQLTGLPANYGNTQVAAYLPTYTGNLNPGNLTVSLNETVGGNLTVTGTTSATGNINAHTINGQLVGTVNGLDPVYGSWDFGSITGLTFENPIAWIFAQTGAGNIDMGTISAPSANNIDIGPIY